MISWWAVVIVPLFAGFHLASGTCANSFWTYYDGACYYFATGKVTYADAKASCAAMANNAQLVSVHSEAEQSFLNSKYGNVKYWLGLEPSSGVWKWNDNTESEYSNWVSTPSITQCPMVNYAGTLGKWSTTGCTQRLLASQGTLCKYYLPATAAPTAAVATPAARVADSTTTTVCATGTKGICVNSFWTYYNGACYYFGAGKVTYGDAKASCAAMSVDAHLVSVQSDAEQDFLNTQYGSVKYWLGLEPSSGNWQWSDGTTFAYSNWQSTPSTSQCPMVNYDSALGKWTTTSCSNRLLANQGTLCKYYVSGPCGTEVATTKPNPIASTIPVTAAAVCADNVGANGISDCPQLAYLCNNVIYYDLMTQECPYTCNRCPGQTPSCSDLLGPDGTTDCPQKGFLCTNTIYWDYMTEQCPFTCNRCPPRATCADKLGPDGTTDCPQKSWLCNEPVYFDYMTEQCPYTCNRCPDSGSTTCADKLGPDGTTDCPQKSWLCENAIYYDYMTEQCPLTCNRC